MKHLLYKLLSMILVTGSVFGADQADQRVENLLNQAGAINSIGNVYKTDEPVKYKLIESQENKKLKGNARVGDIELRPNDKVSVCNIEIFERPDGTTFNKSSHLYDGVVMFYFESKPITAEDLLSKPVNTQADAALFTLENEQPKAFRETLYPVTVAEITEPTFLFNYCREHGKERQARKFGGQKMRHAFSVYDATPTTRVICTTDSTRQIIYTGTREVLLKEKLELREKLGFGEKNRPDCTASNASTGLPPGYRIVG